MEDLRLYLSQVIHRERISLRQDTLRTIILVLSINVLEINRMATGHHSHLYTFRTQLLHRFHLALSQCRDQRIVDVIEMLNRMREIVRGTARHIHGILGGHHLIQGDMPHTAKFMSIHYLSFVSCFAQPIFAAMPQM